MISVGTGVSISYLIPCSVCFQAERIRPCTVSSTAQRLFSRGSGCGAIRARAYPGSAGWMPQATPNTQSATEP